MSGQFEDEYFYQNKSYSYIDADSDYPFDPKSYGLKPDTESCSACQRGYFLGFSIIENKLYLTDLFIETEDQCYPTIAGVEVNFTDKVSSSMGYPVYRNLSLFLPYTGKVLVGHGFLRDYYIHLGYQRLWAYKEVKEFVFEDGVLTKVNDLSEPAAQIRSEVPKGLSGALWDIFEYEKSDAIKPYLNEWWCPAKEQKKWTLDEILLENSKKLRDKNKKQSK